ncbi:asb115 [Agrotis segetum nucleopolyhedrovirus B]|uniref:Asb115 n=1 Tax=Agrotis segetum nucleopolyhedrovirus B TaxID=1580580 RepID=A0A0A7KRI0_9ABAC|nr:asb115 [Agrotis segetum nucleopolyhedrovirus B]AIZ48672.1 asb115 [Agrotis segetum nucleopolyhedrovirus B]
MLITINLKDKKSYLYRMFNRLWSQSFVQCQICLDRIINGGVVAVTEYKTLNLEKMFHAACLQRWQREHTRDPFNRNVKFYFNFPPKSEDECSALLDQMTGFIGDQPVDKQYASEYKRVNDENIIDVDLDFSQLLKYK